jgi:phospholipid transport system substrate-binding protein
MKKIFTIILLAFALVTGPLYAETKTTASSTVQQFYTQLQDVMRNGQKLGFGGRYKKLDPAIRAAFNLPLMTRFAVGSVWTKANSAEQQNLISAFSDFSIATYASRFVAYDGEKFEVVSEKAIPNGVMVETRLTPKGAAPVALNYVMRADDKGAYRIIDVYLDGTISELATRRAEFSSIAGRDGITALVNAIGQKSKQMGPG